MQARFRSMEKPTATAGTFALPHVAAPASMAAAAVAVAAWAGQCIPAHRRANGGRVRPKDFHRGGPG